MQSMPPLSFLLATWFGLGKLPKAPGTYGSLGALPFAWVLQSHGGPLALGLALLILCPIALWAMQDFLRRWPGEDPQEIVIDEVAGQWLVLLFVPAEPLLYFIGFAVFRVLDVSKPWPASWADNHMPGAKGILLDDLFAAVYGCITMLILTNFL